MSSRGAGSTLALAGLAAWLCGCSLRAPHVTENTCNASRDCGTGRVCFANECRSPASALGAVMVEVTPPTSSPFAPLQQALDLKASAVATLDLAQPKRFEGVLVQDSSASGGSPQPVASATLQLYDAQPLIPGRGFSVTVITDPSGKFAARVPPPVQTLRITPPPPLPIFSGAVPAGDTAAAILHLPAAAGLAVVNGTLRSGGLAVAGARVTPVDSSGKAEGASATSDVTGAFTLLLPPPPVQYELRVGDALDGGSVVPGGGPLPSFDDAAFGLRTAGLTSSALALDLDALPPPATLSGRVVDLSGAPVSQARVAAASEDGAGFVLARSTLTAADGSFSLGLRQGRYLVEAQPGADPAQPALSGVLQVSLAAGGSALPISCPAKVRAVGHVLRSGGSPLPAGAQVTATRLSDGLVGGRTATATPTDAAGAYTLIGDPGEYRVEIVPTVESGEPRQLAFVTLATPPAGFTVTELDAIQLSPPLVVAGAVRGSATSSATAPTPMAGASVDVYAVDSAGDAAVKLGSAVTDSAGHFRLVLPDVSQPAAVRR